MRATFLPLFLVASAACAQIPNPDHQIAGALLAAPDSARANATVLGFDSGNNWVTLRVGDGALVCLADNPEKDGFSTACYHQDLDEYMARGRQLRADGITGGDNLSVRIQEIEAGDLSMPEKATMLYVFSGDSFDADSGHVEAGYLRYNIYMPYATEESTGLSTQPSGPGAPWLMAAGTPRAHVMILPPRGD